MVGSQSEVQAQEAWKGLGHTIASGNLLWPVTHIDPQGLKAGEEVGDEKGKPWLSLKTVSSAV